MSDPAAAGQPAKRIATPLHQSLTWCTSQKTLGLVPGGYWQMSSEMTFQPSVNLRKTVTSVVEDLVPAKSNVHQHTASAKPGARTSILRRCTVRHPIRVRSA